jgi:hypothetical protein
LKCDMVRHLSATIDIFFLPQYALRKSDLADFLDDVVVGGSELYKSKEYDQIRSDLKNKHKTIMSNIKKINKCKTDI